MHDGPNDLLDALEEGVVLTGDGVVTRINRAAAELLGTTARRHDGRPAIAVFRDHRIERLEQVGETIELTLRGRTVEVERIRGGFVLRDVSPVRRAEENARSLLAVLSHELRTPVTTVHATLEALAAYDDLEPAERDRLLARARAESERLTRLIDDLTVELAPPRARSVPLAPTVARALALLDERRRDRNVRVDVAVGELSAWADPDKLLQIVLNLLENALVHGPVDATVQVRAETLDGGIALRVRDGGVPLDPSEAQRVFEPHVRGRAARGAGVGLGLYVVRSIVERSRGRCWATPWATDAGRIAGNEFGVWLPTRRTDAPLNAR